MSYRYERYERYRERPRNALRRWLIALTVIVWLLVLACVAVRFVVRPWLTDMINAQIARSINPSLPAAIDPNAALRQSLEQMPIDVTIPPGKITVSEELANRYLADYRQRLQGISDVRVRFVPGEVQAIVTVDVKGVPLSGTARIQPAVENGRIVATNARLDQPLDSVLSVNELLGALQNKLNAELNQQGRRITSIQVDQGQAVVTVE